MGDLDPEQQISIFRFCNPSDLWLKIPVVSQRSLLPPAHAAPEGMGCRWLQMVLDERLWCLLTEETFGITSSDQLVPDEHLTSTARVDSRRIGWCALLLPHAYCCPMSAGWHWLHAQGCHDGRDVV